MASSSPDTVTPEICPFCGEERDAAPTNGSATGGTPRCRACLAFLDPLSRQVTQSHMGPWFLRDATRPFFPGVSWEILVGLINRGDISRESIVRGPGTGQFWMRADHAAGIAHLFGVCHACGAEVARGDDRCGACGVVFPRGGDRDRLGLSGTERLSAFATNEELRAGAPKIQQPARREPPRPQASAAAPTDAGLSALEMTLGQEVAIERRKTNWLYVVVAGLLLVNLGLAAVVLWARR
ncbi:MAG: hypothetical protein U0572_17390 [Phycisphaerales bacterium]